VITFDSRVDATSSPSTDGSETCESEDCIVDEEELGQFLQDTFGSMDADHFGDLPDLAM